MVELEGETDPLIIAMKELKWVKTRIILVMYSAKSLVEYCITGRQLED